MSHSRNHSLSHADLLLKAYADLNHLYAKKLEECEAMHLQNKLLQQALRLSSVKSKLQQTNPMLEDPSHERPTKTLTQQGRAGMFALQFSLAQDIQAPVKVLSQ